MHPIVYTSFRKIIASLRPAGRVLEIGAQPNRTALLAMTELTSLDRVGINLFPESEFEGFKILQGNANCMAMFDDCSFDMILSNAMLEHDQRFWLTCAEIRRVIKPGGIAVIGVPGFSRSSDLSTLKIDKPDGPSGPGWQDSTLTYRYHGFPHDYYRFSERAVRDVLLEGFSIASVTTIMIPPRIITTGRWPAN